MCRQIFTIKINVDAPLVLLYKATNLDHIHSYNDAIYICTVIVITNLHGKKLIKVPTTINNNVIIQVKFSVYMEQK